MWCCSVGASAPPPPTTEEVFCSFVQSQRTASVGWISGGQCFNNIDGISSSEWREFMCESWVVKDNLEMLWVAVFKTDAVVQIFQMSEIRFLPNPMTWDVVDILFKLKWLLSVTQSLLVQICGKKWMAWSIVKFWNFFEWNLTSHFGEHETIIRVKYTSFVIKRQEKEHQDEIRKRPAYQENFEEGMKFRNFLVDFHLRRWWWRKRGSSGVVSKWWEQLQRKDPRYSHTRTLLLRKNV